MALTVKVQIFQNLRRRPLVDLCKRICQRKCLDYNIPLGSAACGKLIKLRFLLHIWEISNEGKRAISSIPFCTYRPLNSLTILTRFFLLPQSAACKENAVFNTTKKWRPSHARSSLSNWKLSNKRDCLNV